MLNFYIFKISNYVKITLNTVNLGLQWLCSQRFGLQLSFLTNEILHFITFVQACKRNLCLTLTCFGWPQLPCDHGCCVQSQGVGFNLINVLSHTSNKLQPLDVACFKPFKTTFKAYTNVWMLANKWKGATKEKLV